MLIPRHIGPKYGNRVTVKQIARYLNGELVAVAAGYHNRQLKISGITVHAFLNRSRKWYSQAPFAARIRI